MLWCRVDRQEAQIKAIVREFGTIREEHSALQACLVSDGRLRSVRFQTELHRSRFSAALQRHPCPFDRCLLDAMSNRHLGVAITRYAGLSALRELRVVSKGLIGAAETAQRRFDTVFPPRLFVVGGFDGTKFLDTAEAFDAETRTWRILPPMTTQRAAAATVAINDRLYVAGGHDGQSPLRNAERYIPETNTWEVLPPMRIWRSAAAAVTIRGTLYVAGGTDDGTQALNSFECFNPGIKAWQALPSMMSRRKGAAAAVLYGRLYVLGGHDGNQPLNTVEFF